MEEILEPEIKEAIDRWTKINKENASLAIEELSQHRECIRAKKTLHNRGDVYYVARFYYNLANAKHYKDEERAMSILEEGREWYKSVRCNYFEPFGWIYRELFFQYADTGREAKAEEVAREGVYLEFSSISSSVQYENLELYSFYPVGDHHIEDLQKFRISLSDPYTFNDPVDCPVFEWLKQQEMLEYPERIRLIRKMYSDIRIRCFVSSPPFHSLPNLFPKASSFVQEYGNILMWSHYADSHKGYCVKYRFVENFFGSDNRGSSVLFLDKVKYILDMNVSKSKMQINLEESFFVKHKSWDYEQEMRLIYFDKDETSDSYHKVPMLDGMITDIYFGVHCKESDKLRIIEALRGKKVQYHQMEVDPEHLYSLKEVPIDPSTYERKEQLYGG